MSDNYDDDIEQLLASVMKGENPELDALDNPPPLELPEPEPEEILSSTDSDITIDDIMEEVVHEPTPEDSDLHACKTEQDETGESVDDTQDETGDDVTTAALEPIDESQWSTEVPIAAVELPSFSTDDALEDLDIRQYGTLVSLNTVRWHAKVRDHKAAADASSASGADKAAFEARKRLLVGADEKLRAVFTAIDAARTEHYRMTLPWSVVGVNDHGKRAGARLLPNTLFFEYTQAMAKYKSEMDDALDKFVQAYPTLIAIAQKKLGSAFDVTQYPAPSQIRSYFGLSFDFAPIPKGSDFEGTGIAQQQAEKLAMNVNKRTAKMLDNAMQEVWKRLHDDLEHMHVTLKDPNAKFHYTLIDKMKEHAQMIKHLNVVKDTMIETVRKRIDMELSRYDVKQVRKDDALRAKMAESAKQILECLKLVGQKETPNVSATKTN